MTRLKVLRRVGNYSLMKKGTHYYIDNGIDDVSEYFDYITAYYLNFEISDLKFLKECASYF